MRQHNVERRLKFPSNRDIRKLVLQRVGTYLIAMSEIPDVGPLKLFIIEVAVS